MPYEQSVLMAQALSCHGVEHAQITMAERGHAFDSQMDDPVVQDAFDRVLTFLERHIGSN